MNYWITTDTHFGHTKMIQAAGRPHDFAQRVLKNIAKTIQPEDILIHLGDICIGNDIAWHSELIQASRAKRYLCLGNHDHRSNSWYTKNGWDFVCNSFILHMYGKKIAFSHHPLEDSVLYDINFHGHHHNTLHHPEDKTSEKHQLLYIEHHYQPFNLKTLMTKKAKT